MNADLKRPSPKPTEEAEPKADFATAPVLLIGLFALLFFLGLVYLGDHGGGFNPHVYQPYASFDELDARNKALHPIDPTIQIGKQKFTQVCAACHMVNGMGSAAVGAPPLAGSDWVQAEGPNRIIRIVLNGLSGPIQVSGNQYGTGAMVPLKDAFTDQEIAAVLTYVRQEWGNKAGPVKPEQVKAIRAETAAKSDNWNAADLLQIPAK